MSSIIFEHVKTMLDFSGQLLYNSLMKQWTQAEDQHLLDWYGLVPNSKLAKHLPGRSVASIRARVHRLRRKGYKFNRNENSRADKGLND